MQPRLECGRRVPSVDRRSLSASEMDSRQERLRRYLEENHLKYSEPRWIIATVVLSEHRHMTAQEIVRLVEERHPDIGSATVYRNIKTLCDAKILRETLFDSSGRVLYEPFDEDHHDHVVCLDCGHIFEFHSEQIETEQSRVLSEMRFSQVGHRHVIYTKCDFLEEGLSE